MFLFVQNACRDVLTGFVNLSTSIFVSPQGMVIGHLLRLVQGGVHEKNSNLQLVHGGTKCFIWQNE